MNLSHGNGFKLIDCKPSHENVGVCWCHFRSHGRPLNLQVVFTIKFKVVAFEDLGEICMGKSLLSHACIPYHFNVVCFEGRDSH